MMAWDSLRIAVTSSFNPPATGMRYQAEVISDAFEEEGASVLRVTLQQNRYLRPLSTCWELLSASNEYDTVCVQAFSYGNFLNAAAAILTARMLRKRVIVTYRGGAAPQFLKKYKSASRLLKLADTIVTPSRYLKDIFSQLGFVVREIPNLIDLSEYPFKERMHFKPRLVWVRHLRDGYNPWMAIEAVRQIQRVHPDATLTLIGGGYLYEKLLGFVRSESIQGIHLTGDIPQRELRVWLERSDIFISTTNYDNLPRSLLEAMSAGLPVVSTDVGGIPYLIDAGKNGLLVPPEDVDALATAVLDIVRSPSLGQELVREARSRMDRFTWAHAGPLWYSVLAGKA